MDDTYISSQIGAAKVTIEQAFIESFGSEYNPASGFKIPEKAMLENGSKEAAMPLKSNLNKAAIYGIRATTLKLPGERHE